MPVKTCMVGGPRCEGVFFARWRNTPSICGGCALHVIVCPACWHVTIAHDPLQLPLFTLADAERRGVWSSVDVMLRQHFANVMPHGFDWETYTEKLLSEHAAPLPDTVRASWPRHTTDAERRRYPFH